MHMLDCIVLRVALAEVWPSVTWPASRAALVEWFCWMDRPGIKETFLRALIVDIAHKAFKEVQRGRFGCPMGPSIEARLRHWLRRGGPKVKELLLELEPLRRGYGRPLPMIGL